jgi:hypothetical protein
MFRPDPVAGQLGDPVRFADVFTRPAVLVNGGDVQVAVGIALLVLGDGPLDAGRLAGVEVGREAVMGERVRDAECADDDGGS